MPIDRIGRSGSRALIGPGQHRPVSNLPQIDWSHPLAQGLLFYGYDNVATAGWVDSGTSGAGISAPVIDLVTGAVAFRMGTGAFTVPTTVGTPFGPAYQYNGNNANNFAMSLVNGTAIQNAQTGNYSYACAFIKTGTVGQYSRPFGRTANNGGSAPFVNWDFEINPGGAGQTVINANCNNSGNLATTSPTNTIADNTYTTAVGTVTSNTLTLYLNGVAGGTVGSLTPSSTNTNDAIMFGGSSGAVIANPFLGQVFYGAFWNRVLSADEILTLHLDPYCFLVYERPIQVEVATLPPEVSFPTQRPFRQQQNSQAYEDEQLNQEWSELQRLRTYRTTWQVGNESVSKFVQYDVLTTPTASVAVSKFAQYDVLSPPSGLAVSKAVQYVVIQTPVTTLNATMTGVGGTGQVGTVTTTISSQKAITGVSGTSAAGTVTPDQSTFAVWSASDLSSTTLDASHLVATSTAQGGVRATTARQSGKYYFEITTTTIVSNNTGVGIAAARATLATVGPTPTAAVIMYKLGGIWVNNVSIGTNAGALSNGSVVCIAVDFDNQLIWFRVGAAGNWNGSASNNPATGVGGVSIASAGIGIGFDGYPVAAFGGSADKATANFGASAFTGSAPSGFTSGLSQATGTINVVATQVGAEVFYSPNNAAVQLTQIGVEAFYAPTNPQYQVTQVGFEVWGSTSDLTYNITQVGFEVWASVAQSPPVTGVTGYGVASQPFSSTTPGVGGSGSAGGLSITVDDSKTLTGVAGTGRGGTVIASDQISITGNSATGSAGIATSFSPPSSLTLTGVAGTSAIGTATIEIDVSLAGVQAIGAAGSALGQPITLVSITGVEATGNTGTPTFTVSSSVMLTGVAGTGSAGRVFGDHPVASISGVQGTSHAGSLTPSYNATASLTGVSGSGNAGNILAGLVAPSVSATGAAGTPSLVFNSNVHITGVRGTSHAGTVIGLGDQYIHINGVSGTSHVGTVIGLGDGHIHLTSVSAHGYVGSLNAISDPKLIHLTGLRAFAHLGVLVLGGIRNIPITGVSAQGGVGDLQAAHPGLRQTQVGAEVFMVPEPAVQTSQAGVEAFVVPEPAVDVSQFGAEVYTVPVPTLQPTQVGAEVFVVPTARLQITQVGVEVWFPYVLVVNATETVSGLEAVGEAGVATADDINPISVGGHSGVGEFATVIAEVDCMIFGDEGRSDTSSFADAVKNMLVGLEAVGYAASLKVRSLDEEIMVMYL